MNEYWLDFTDVEGGFSFRMVVHAYRYDDAEEIGFRLSEKLEVRFDLCLNAPL